MSKVIAASILALTAAPAFANVNIPSPEILPLLGIGAVAVMVARKRNKKS